MRIKIVWSVFVVALFLLLLFQSVFLYNTFSLEHAAVQDELTALFKESLEKEVSDRFIHSSKMMEAEPEKYNTMSFSFKYDDNSRITEQGLMSVDFQHQQVFLDHIGFPFELAALDSIFRSQLLTRKISLEYNLIYRDSTNMLASIGNFANTNFEVEPVPLVKERTVQIFIVSPIPFILKEMLGILIVSMLMLLLIVACLVYEMRVIFTQRRLARLRDDFSHALIHDMKTPLGTIYMAVDQWGKGNLDTKPELRTKFCETAMTQVLGLQALVDKILTIARMEQNKLTLERRITDVPAMIDGLVDKFKVQARKSVRFEVDIQMEDCSVVADPIYLQNAISNVIDNAIKYSGNSVEIHILCRSQGEQLFIEIADNGFGISTNDQQKIFEKFERGAAVWRKGAKGFGLGLNYVKRVMEAHGGTVSLCSLEGEGSKFILYIPLKMVAI